MDRQTLAYRAEIARRLKAGRWLAGSQGPKKQPDKGRVPVEVSALSPEQLSDRAPLPENEITASLLGSIERMERHTTPMELRAIAEALDLVPDWFVIEDPATRFAAAARREAERTDGHLESEPEAPTDEDEEGVGQ